MEEVANTMEHEIVKVDNLDIAVYQNFKEGEPIVFIHGTGLCGEIFHRQYNTYEAEKYRYISIDLPGHGRSSVPKDTETVYSPQGLQHIIQEVLKELRIENPVLVGHSIGSQLAVELTKKIETKGLILTGATLFKKPNNPQEAMNKLDALMKLTHGTIDHKTALEVVDSILHPDRPAHEFIVKCMKNTDGSFYTYMSKLLNNDMFEDETEILKNYDKPVGLIQGTMDPVSNNDYLETLEVKNLWEGKIHYIPDTGHLPFWEIPESFNALMKRYIWNIYDISK